MMTNIDAVFFMMVFYFPAIDTKLSYYTYSTENGFNFYKQVLFLN
jgi:hypothetical protein